MATINISEQVMNSTYGDVQQPIKQMIIEKEEAIKADMPLQNQVFKNMSISTFAARFEELTSMANYQITGESQIAPETDFRTGYNKVLYPLTWENSFTLSQELKEDQIIDNAAAGISKLATTYARTREQVCAKMLSQGTTTSMTFGNSSKPIDIAGADTKALFADDHPSVTGGTGTQSNFFNGSFSYENLFEVMRRMQNFTDENGNILNVIPDTIIVPNSTIIRTVHEVLNTQKVPYTNDNTYNTVYGRFKLIVSPYLTSNTTESSDQYIIMMDSKLNQDLLSMILIDRIPLSIRSFLRDENYDNVWKGRTRFNVGSVRWQAASMLIEGTNGTSL
jgi:hypothetical protein